MKVGKIPVASIILLVFSLSGYLAKRFYPTKFPILSPWLDAAIMAALVVYLLYYVNIWIKAWIRNKTEELSKS